MHLDAFNDHLKSVGSYSNPESQLSDSSVAASTILLFKYQLLISLHG